MHESSASVLWIALIIGALATRGYLDVRHCKLNKSKWKWLGRQKRTKGPNFWQFWCAVAFMGEPLYLLSTRQDWYSLVSFLGGACIGALYHWFRKRI